MKHKLFARLCAPGMALLFSLAFAEAPIEDLSAGAGAVNAQTNAAESRTSAAVSGTTVPESANDSSSPQESLTEEQRLDRLDQQVANIARMNLPQQVSELQQQLSQLRGELEVQSHDLKLLNSQQRSFYQDLDQRITQLKGVGATAAAATPSASSPAAVAPTNRPANPAGAHNQLNDSNAFQAAFSLLTQKKLGEAERAFQSYLSDYPGGTYVANTHYWLGEIYLQQQNNKLASQEFTTMINQFPTSTKVPDAKLKLAVIDATTGKVSQARDELVQIKKQHPGTTAAQLASIRLQQLDDINSTQAASQKSP